MLYISHREQSTKVLGPGLRYVIWVQGCKKNCAGCINPAGRPLDKNGYYITVDELFHEINSNPKLTGITISGGEPFLQVDEIAKLVNLVKTETHLDIMVYTGYTLDELKRRNDPAINEILKDIDLLVDGEYIESQNTNKIYRGSDNQIIHFLSDKYVPFKTKIESTHNRSVEFIFRDSGELFIVGIPVKGFQNHFIDNIFKQ